MAVITDFVKIESGLVSTDDPNIISFTTAGSTAASAAYVAGEVVELLATEDCYVSIAETPTASSSTYFLVAKTYKRFRIPRDGTTYDVAARGVVNSGSLYISLVTI